MKGVNDDDVPTPNSDIVQQSIGSLGRWHLFVCLAIFCVKFPVAWHQLSIVFLAPPILEFNCSDPEIDTCAPECPYHEFNRTIFTETIITQWDLVCDRSQLANVAQLTTMFGILLGNVLFGYLSDKFGRRVPLVAAVVVQVLSGIGAAFAPWFVLFLILRLICAMATGGTMVTSFVLVMELVGTKWRTTLGVLYQIPFNMGHLSLAGLSYLLRDWKYLQIAISLPSAILVTYYWILPESPRWLLAVGKVDESIEMMEKAAKHNHLPTAQIRDEVQKYVQINNKSTENRTGNMFDLIRTPNIRIRTLAICFNWIVCGLCFFGVAQFLGQIGGNIFINVALSAVIQLPGTFLVIYLLQNFGRRATLIFANLLAGCSCLIVAFLPASPTWPTTMFGCLGMLGLSLSFPTVYIYSGELFPTVIRNIGVGVSSMSARIGSMLAPFVAGLTSVDPSLPPIIFGVIPLIGALLCLKLPETLNCKLADTLEEAEQFGTKKEDIQVVQTNDKDRKSVV